MAGHSSVSQSAPAHTHIPITTLWNSDWVRKRHRERDGMRESKSVRKISCHTETFTSASVYGHYILYLWLKWGVHYRSMESVCVCVRAQACMTKKKKPHAQMFVSVYMCGCSLPQKGDETWYKLTLGFLRAAVSHSWALALVPQSDVELPVKQEAFKCWLESYGIACGNIFGEVKRRGQHSKTFHVKVLSRQTAQVFLVLPGCFNCHVPAIGGSAQLYQFPIAADRGALTGIFGIQITFSLTAVLFLSKVCWNKTNQWKYCHVHATYRTKITSFFFLFFLFSLPWVSEGHKLCHVVYMLTQKEGQVLAIRSLGLMWPGHGHGSSESPVEP